MGVVAKHAINTSIYSYIGALLGIITVWFVYREWLTAEQNGLLNLLISITLVTGSVSTLGTAGMTIKMFPHFRDTKSKHNGFLFYPIMATLIGFGGFLLLYYLFKQDIVLRNNEKSQLFTEYIYYLVPMTLSWGLYCVFDAYSRSVYLISAGVILKEVILRIIVLVSAYLYYRKYISFEFFVFLYCGSFCLITVMLAAFLYYKDELHIGPVKGFLTPEIRREMFSVSGYAIITGLSSLLISSIDKIIVNDKLGLAAAGVFAIATFFGSVIQIPARSIIRISSSVIADAWKSNDVPTISELYYKTCLNQLIIGLIMTIVLAANLDNIISLMPPEYAAGKYVVIIMAVAYLIDMATGVNGIIIGTSKFFRYDTYFMICLVAVTFITNLILIPKYGIVGAAIASCITYFLFNFSRFIFIWYKFKMQPFDMATIKVLLCGGIAFALSFLLPQIGNQYFDMIVRSGIIAVLFFVLIFHSGISPELNQMIKKKLPGFNR